MNDVLENVSCLLLRTNDALFTGGFRYIDCTTIKQKALEGLIKPAITVFLVKLIFNYLQRGKRSQK